VAGEGTYPLGLRPFSPSNVMNVAGTARSYSSNTPGTNANPDHPSGSTGSTPDSIKFCLACHGANSSLPAGMNPAIGMGANPPLNIANRWLAAGTGGLAHGNGASSLSTEGSPGPRSPYQNVVYAALQCTTCHDAHGSPNVYLLREYIVVDNVLMNASNTYLNAGGVVRPIVVRNAGGVRGWVGAGSLTNDFIAQFCGTCHTANGKFSSHHGGIAGTYDAPDYGVNCDSRHNWGKVAGSGGLHDNTARGASAGSDTLGW
jgi:hypothetical protein